MIGRLLGRRAILSEREQDLRAREHELLDRLAGALERFGTDVDPDDLRRFREARDQLEGLFLLVVAGEFNSGKSSFINALLGERVLPEGVTPTTDRINLLHHGPEVTERAPGVKAVVQDAVESVGQQVKEKAGRVKEEAKLAVKETRPGRGTTPA